MSIELTNAVQEFVITLVVGVLGLLATFLIALAKKGLDLALAKIESVQNQNARENLNDAVCTLHDLVTTTVTALQQTTVEEIKNSIKSGDGKFTQEDLYHLKDVAVDTIKTQLSATAAELLEDHYGDLSAYIGDLVETQVLNLKLNMTQDKTPKTLLE